MKTLIGIAALLAILTIVGFGLAQLTKREDSTDGN